MILSSCHWRYSVTNPKIKTCQLWTNSNKIAHKDLQNISARRLKLEELTPILRDFVNGCKDEKRDVLRWILCYDVYVWIVYGPYVSHQLNIS